MDGAGPHRAALVPAALIYFIRDPESSGCQADSLDDGAHGGTDGRIRPCRDLGDGGCHDLLDPVLQKYAHRFDRICAAEQRKLYGGIPEGDADPGGDQGTVPVLYFLCYGITYGYNAYFWDNSIAKSLLPGALCWWLFGVWVLAWLLLFSAIADSSTHVLFGTGGAALAAYVLGLFPKAGKFLPVKLMDGMNLLYGNTKPADYGASAGIACGMAAVCVLLAVVCFDRKRL